MTTILSTRTAGATFGASHGPAIGGCPPGMELSEEDIQPVDRRIPGPTSSIRPARRSIDIEGNAATIETRGRHDPCVGIRATPIAEAFPALVLIEHALRHRAQNGDMKESVGDSGGGREG